MREIEITAKIQICDYNALPPTDKKLITAAKDAVFQAYAPYSGFQVGAAVLLANQEIIAGSNQENVAYPSGLCAERTALFYANARYPDAAVEAIAIAAHTGGRFTEQPISPCGACRQVMVEVQNRYRQPFRILLYGEKSVYVIRQIADLLPLAFDSL